LFSPNVYQNGSTLWTELIVALITTFHLFHLSSIVWVAIYLFRTRHLQRQAFEETASETVASSYRRLYRTISSTILYRTTIYAVLYMFGATMSFIPTLVEQFQYFMYGTETPDREKPYFVEFSTPIAGIGMFLVFGTGSHAMAIWRNLWRRIRHARRNGNEKTILVPPI
jgi:hypothetical protein